MSRLVLVGHVGGPDRKSGNPFHPFPGHADRMLRESARLAGLDLTDAYMTTVWKYPRLTAADLTTEEIKIARPRIMDELASVDNIGLIVVMGDSAAKAILKRTSKEKRGEEVSIQLGSRVVKVLPTYHPQAMYFRPRARPTFVKQLVRAKHLLAGDKMLTPAQSVVLIDELNSEKTDWWQDVLGPGVVALDAETDEHDRVRMIGLGATPDKVYVSVPNPASWLIKFAAGITWVGHNIRSDQHWLLDAGIALDGPIEDTMLMAHLLDENRRVGLKHLALMHLDPELYWAYVEPLLKDPEDRGAIPYEELARYCANDVAVTLILWGIFRQQMADYPKLERIYRHISLPLSNALLTVERNGVPFDTRRAEGLYDSLGVAADNLTVTLNQQAGRSDLNWNSDAQVASLLYDEYGITAPYRTKSGKRGSVDETALMKIRYSHPVVETLVEHRHIVKQQEIVMSWLSRARDGWVYPTYNIAGTVTGRISGRNPNPQNVPTDSTIRSLIRHPDPDWCILAADYRTIELGVAAWLFEEERLLAAYVDQITNNGPDLHTLTATAMLGRPPANKDERKKYGKTPNFGLLYQQGDQGYMEYAAKQGVKLTLEQSAEMRAQWHALYPGIRGGWQKYGMMLKEHGYVEMPSGRRRRLPEFNSGIKKLVNRAWREGVNAPVQGTAAELTHVAAILADRDMCGPEVKLVLHVHDSLVFAIRRSRVAAVSAQLRTIMERNVPTYFKEMLQTEIVIPLGAEVSVGESWGEQDGL